LIDPMLEQRHGRTRKQLAHQLNATATNVHSVRLIKLESGKRIIDRCDEQGAGREIRIERFQLTGDSEQASTSVFASRQYFCGFRAQRGVKTNEYCCRQPKGQGRRIT
jgi:hypothetical protein